MSDGTSPVPVSAAGQSASTGLPRWLAGLLALTLALTALHWLVLTEPVRIANHDDQGYQHIIDANTGEAVSTEFAQFQGRFYYATPFYWHTWEIYRIANPWIFAAVRLAFLLLQFGLLAWLAARLANSRVLGWLVLLAALAALHLPTTYFAALSYPVKWMGFCALLGSLHLQLTGLATGSRLAGLFSGLLFLIAALCLELFLGYLPLFVVLALWRKPNLQAALRSLAPQLAGFAAYLLAYALFARAYPSTYGGTQLSFKITEVANTLFRQTIGIVPGFELLAHRTNPAGGGSWHKSATEVLAALRAMPVIDCGLALLQACTLVALAGRMPAADRLPRYLLPAAGLCILLPNLPLSLTAMHQVAAYHRLVPYIYGFYAYGALIVAAVLLWWRVAARLPATGWKSRLWSGLAVTACLVVFLSAKASNHTNLTLLHSWFN